VTDSEGVTPRLPASGRRCRRVAGPESGTSTVSYSTYRGADLKASHKVELVQILSRLSYRRSYSFNMCFAYYPNHAHWWSLVHQTRRRTNVVPRSIRQNAIHNKTVTCKDGIKCVMNYAWPEEISCVASTVTSDNKIS
jgi:hypothetical protein